MTQWSVTIPGQPVSWDKAYKTGRVALRKAGQAVLNEDFTQRYVSRPVLTPEARTWKETVLTLCRLAKPSGFRPEGQIRVLFDLRLATDMDDDNACKLARDSLAEAIGHDDRYFLACTRSKESGRTLRDACLIITVDTDPSHW